MVKRGDIIWLDPNPQEGQGQGARRLALVINNDSFSQITKTAAIVCPIAETDKDFPFYISLDDRTQTKGAVLCDQVKIVNVQARGFEFVEKAPHDIIFEVVDIVYGFIELI
jgi:mRNA interferase MazF